MVSIKNFFKVMCDCVSFFTNINIDSLEQDEFTSLTARMEVFRHLVSFVESGTFTKSETEKFICCYWSRTSDYVCELWNETHKNKSKNTMRSQIKTLSDRLYRLFDVDDDLLFGLFSDFDSSYEELLSTVDSVCVNGIVGDVDFSGAFSYSLMDYVSGCSSDKDYTMEECSKELELLGLLHKEHLLSLFQCCDKDKLAFLAEQMRAPLFLENTDELETSGGKIRLFRYPTVNEYKLAFCDKFRSLISDGVSVDSCFSDFVSVSQRFLAGSDSGSGFNGSPADVVAPNQYGLSVSEDFLAVLNYFYNKPINGDEAPVDNTAVNIYIERLKDVTPLTDVTEIGKIMVISGHGNRAYNFKVALDRLKYEASRHSF